jgi:hypothetical protein
MSIFFRDCQKCVFIGSTRAEDKDSRETLWGIFDKAGMKEKNREGFRVGGTTLPRLGQSRSILIFSQPCGVRCYGVQDLLDGASDDRSSTRLGQPRLGARFEEPCAVGTQGIPREKNHPSGQVNILTQHEGVQVWTAEVWQTQVTQEDIIAMGLKLGQSDRPIFRRIYCIAIPAQDSGEPPHKAPFIINHQNPHRRVEGARLQTKRRGRCCTIPWEVT